MRSVLALVLLGLTGVQASGYTDEHNDGTLTGWTSVGTRTWSESGGYALPQDMTSASGFLINDYAATADGTFNYTIKAMDTYNCYYGGGVFRYTDATHFYFIRLNVMNPSSTHVSNTLSMCTNTVASTGCTQIASNLNFAGLNSVYPIRVVLAGSTFKFYLNGTLVGQLTDATNATGKVGYAYGAGQYYGSSYLQFDRSDWTDAAPASITYTWTGNSSSDWGTSTNWSPNGVPGASDNIIVDKSGGATIALNGNRSVANITLGNASSNAMTLQTGSSGTLTISSGGAVSTNASSTGTHVISCPVALSASMTATVANSGGAVDIQGAISGAFPIVKAGSGTLKLSGANSYSGATSVTAGILQLGNTSALGASSGVSVTSGAALDLNGQNYSTAIPLTLNGTGISSGGALFNSSSTGATYAGLVTLGSATSIIGGAGAINLSNTGTITGSGYGLTLGGAQGGTLAGILGTGSGTLAKQDAGNWTLSGANTYTGTTTISAGTIKVGNAAALGGSGSGTAVQPGATLDLNGFAIGAEVVDIAGTGVGGNGAIVNSGADEQAGIRFLTMSADASIGGSHRFDVRNVSGGEYFNANNHTLTKVGSGWVTMNNLAVSNFNGIVVSGGTFGAEWQATFPSGGAGFTVQSGTNLALWQTTGNTAPISMNNATLWATSSTENWLGTISLTGANTILVDGTNLTLSGVVSGSGSLTKTGANPLILSAANTYSGATNISAGTLQLGIDNAIPSGSAVVATGTLDMNGHSDAIGALAGGGTVDNSTGTGAYTLTVGGSGTNTTFSGTIKNTSGSVALTKNGTGTTTLSGTNTFAGATTVNAGTLLVNGTDASSALTVNAGATVGGTGTVGGVTVASGGILSPGVSGAGTLNSGAFTMASGSVLNVDLGTSSDLVAVTGNLSLAGTVNVTTGTGFGPGTYTLFTFTGSLTANTLAVGTIPAGYSGQIVVSGSQVNLVLTKSLTITGTFTASDKAYDGTATASINTNGLSLSGVVGSDVVNLVPALVFSSATVASGKTVSLTGSGLSGADAAKYTLSLAGAPTTTAAITAKTLTIAGSFAASNKVYDGSTAATIGTNGLTLSGVVGADVVSLVPAAVFSDASAASGKTVSLTGSSLSGANASSYTLSLGGAPTATATITAKSLTIGGSFTANDKAYDNTTAATIGVNSLTLVGKVGADVLTLSPNLVFSDATVASGKTVSLTGSTIGGAAASNYALSLTGAPTTTASITTRSLTITGSFTASDKSYDGTATASISTNSLVLSGVLGTDIVTLSPNLVFSDATVASGKTVSLTGSAIGGANASNYALSLTGAPTTTAAITAKALTIGGSFTANDKVYDNTAAATINGNSLTLLGKVGSEVVTLSPALVFSDALVASGKTVSLTGSTIGGANASNYTLSMTGAPTTTASITAKTLTIGGSFTANDKAFDNTTTATINVNSLTLTGKLGSDVVILNPTPVFSDATVASGKTVSLTGSTIGGAAASNYALSMTGAPTATAAITAKALTITGSFTANDKVYDGSISASINANSLVLSGVVGTDVVNLAPVLVFSSAAVASGKTVSLTGSSLTGADASKYTLSLGGAPTTTASITAKTLTIGGSFTANDKAYDKTSTATFNVNSLTLVGKVGSDAVVLTPVPAFADAAVGTGKTVGLTGSTIGGAAASNYALSTTGAPTATAAISAKALTITGSFTANDKVYDGTATGSINGNSLVLSGVVGGDVVSLNPVLAFSDPAAGGSKPVTLTGSSLGGANASSYVLSLTGAPTTTAAITAKTLTVGGSFTVHDKPFDNTATATMNVNGLTLVGKVGSDVVSLSPTPVFSDALVGATKTVTLAGSSLTGTDASNYALSLTGAPTTTAAITSKSITITGSFTASNKAYDGTNTASIATNSLILNGVVGGDLVSLTPVAVFSDALVASGKTVGLTGSVLSGADAAKYTLSLAGAPTTTASITARSLTVVGGFTASNKTYDGTNAASIATNSLTLSGVVGADDVTLTSASAFSDAQAASGKTVSLTGSSLGGAKASQYTLSLAGAPTTTATITAKPLTVGGSFTANNKPSDGNTSATINDNSLTLLGKVAGDDVSLVPVLQFADATVASGKVVSLSGSTSLSGTTASNYALSLTGAPTTTAAIIAKGVTITGTFTANNKTYDGTSTATIATNGLTLSGVAGGDVVTLIPNLVFSDAAVGPGKTVTLTGSTLGGANGPDYAIFFTGAPTTTASITAKTLTVGGSFTAHDKPFDNTATATIDVNSLTLVGKVGSDAVALSPTLAFSSAAVGSGKTVSLTGGTLTGSEAGNYALSVASAPTTTASITTKVLTITGTFTANDKTYDGTAAGSINSNGLSLSGVVAGDAVSLAPGLVFSDAQVGTGKAVTLAASSLSGADAAKYTLSVAGAPTATAAITARTLTVGGSFTANDKVFDKTAAATINANSLVPLGKVGTEDVTLSPTVAFSNASVGTGKTVGLTGCSLGGADAANYVLSLTGAPTTTAAITAKALTIGGSFTANNKTYDGTAAASINTSALTLGGVETGDVVTLSPALAFSSAAVASGKTVSLTGSSLGGANASNYSLSLTGAPTATASITAKTLTVGGSFTAHDKPFDNTTAATINANALTLLGKVGSDAVSLDPVLVFEDASVGTGKIVDLTGSGLSGSDAGNYALSLAGAPTTTASITTKSLTIAGSFTANSKAYDGTTAGSINVNGLSLSGIVAGDVVALNPGLTFSDAQVGATKTVTLAGSTLGGADASKYSLSLAGAPTTTAAITAKPLTIGGSFTAHDKPFDNTTAATINGNSLTLLGKVGSETVTLAPTLVFENALAGSGKIVSLTGSSLGGANASNYTLSLAGAPTTTASITVKTVTISGTFTVLDKTYDGTATGTINSNGLVLGGVLGGDVVTLTPGPVFSDAAVGTTKTVSLTGSSLTGANASNYSLSLSGAPTTTASIAAKTLTVGGSFTANNKVFDNTVAATIDINSLTLSGKVGADIVTLSPTLVFSDAAVGTTKTVSLVGSGLSGANASNYVLSLTGAPTTTASIAAKALTVGGSFTASNKAFDNTATATISTNSLTLLGKIGGDVVSLVAAAAFSDAAVGSGKTVSLTGSSLSGANASNYILSLAGSPTTTASITSKGLTIGGSFTVHDKTYDGSASASIDVNSLTLVGVSGGDVVALVPAAAFSSAAVGPGKPVTLAGSSLGGADASNYTLSLAGAPTTTGAITAKSLTITGTFTAHDKTYDGTAATTVNTSSMSLSGIVGAEVVTLSPSPVFSDALVGSGKPVTLTGSTIGGANASNYTLSLTGAPTTTAAINAKALTIGGTFTAHDKVFDNTAAATINADALTLVGKVGTEVVSLSPVLAFSDALVGSGKPVTLAGSTIGGANASNYTLSLAGAPTTTASITARSLTVAGTFTANDKVYDGTATASLNTNNLTLSGVLGGDVVSLNSVLVFADAQVGATKSVSLTGSTLGGVDASKYSLSLVGAPTATAAIAPKPITISPTMGQGRAYGNADPVYAYTNSEWGNNSNLTGALGRAAGSAVGTYAFNLGTLTAGANYTLGLETSPPTFEISARPVTLSANAQTKAWGVAGNLGTSAFTITVGSLAAAGDITGVSLASTGAVDTASPGTYPIVPSAASGPNVGNYSITYASGVLTVGPRPNTAPSFTMGTNQSVLENSGARTVANWATAISKGAVYDSAQSVGFRVTNRNPTLFSGQPAISSNGTLSFTPATNQSGVATVRVRLGDNGGTAIGGVDSSAVDSFTITVTWVNQAPSFAKGANQTVGENAGAQSVSGWASAISKGPANESAQTVGFRVHTASTSLFSAQPSVSPSGTLTYTPAANATGVATVHVRLGDDGGAANGGVDSSAVDSFTISVAWVNQAPSFVKGSNQVVRENAGAQSVANWANAISKGPASDSAQTLGFRVSTASTSLFSAQPSVSSSGTLTYTPAANANGAATVLVRLGDNGGTANGGVDSSALDSFTITVTAVNQAPSFVKGSNQVVRENAGAQSVANWASAISKGAANESAQSVGFRVSTASTSLFSAQPSLSSSGTLTYTPAANATGVATVLVRLGDNGGTADGGVDSSAVDSFTIAVTWANQAPGFAKGSNQVVRENAGAQTVANWATSLSKGPASDSAQTLGFRVSTANTSLFSAQPSLSSSGVLTFTPAAYANGVATVFVRLGDNGGTANGGVDSSALDSFTITVTAVNQAPSFVKGANQAVGEISGVQTVANWATSLSKGPANESGQTLGFRVSTSNAALFSVAPSVSPTGTLTFAPAANRTGVATVHVRLGDNGGTADGGVDSSAVDSFTITVTWVNQAPGFVKGANQTVRENASAQTVGSWASAITKGPASDSAQALGFRVSTANTSLFSAQPSISSSGTLTYTPAANANGAATVHVRLGDNGGTANGGVDSSAVDSFTITITPVNQAPSFVKGANVSVDENAGAQTIANWATAVSKGPANESNQTLGFRVSGSNAALFSAAPTISYTGTLAFAPGPYAWGVATVYVRLGDNGGTADGGVDSSAVDSFTITVRKSIFLKIKPGSMRLRPADSATFQLVAQTSGGRDTAVSTSGVTWSWSANLGGFDKGHIAGAVAGTATVYAVGLGTRDSAQLVVVPLDTTLTAGTDSVLLSVGSGVNVVAPPRTSLRGVAISIKDSALGTGFSGSTASIRVQKRSTDTASLLLRVPMANIPSAVRSAMGDPVVFSRDSLGAVRTVSVASKSDSVILFRAHDGGQYWVGYDTLAPSISSNLSGDSIALSRAVDLDFSLKDNTADAQAYLCMLKAGASVPTCSLVVVSDTATGSFKIPKALVPLGAQVWMEGRDSRSTIRSARKDVVVQLDTLQALAPREEDRYDLVSLPYLARGRVYDAFARQFGPADPAKWRAFRTESGGFKEVLPGDTVVANGVGYWVRSRKTPLSLWVARNWTTPVSVPVQVVLKPGWNTVGNPYGFDVSWSQVRRMSGLDTALVYGPYAFDGATKSWSLPDTALSWKAWSGVAMLNSTGKPFTLQVPGTAPQSAAGRTAVAGSWTRLGLRGWQRADDTGRVWMGIDAALDTNAKNSQPLPPMPGRELAMGIASARIGDIPLLAEVRRPTDSGVRWTVRVSGLRAGVPLEMGFSKSGTDTAREVWIMDAKSGRWLECQPRMSFAVGTESAREFQVLAGASPRSILDLTRFGLENRSHGVAWFIPQDMGRTHVRIALYDIQGRELLRLVDEDMDPGSYTRNIAQRFPTERVITLMRAGGRHSSLGAIQMR